VGKKIDGMSGCLEVFLEKHDETREIIHSKLNGDGPIKS